MSLLPDQEADQTRISQELPDKIPTVLAGFRSDAWLLPDDAQLGFVAVPAGPFPMGGDTTSDPLSFDNERWTPNQAQGIVDLPLFYIGRFEVTVGQFATFVEETGHRVAVEALASPPDHPVSSVSWPDALAYCRWLDGVLRRADDTPEPIRQLLGAGGRVTLPSEAEWEKAARGPDDRVYPWGDEPRRDRANFRGTATTAVGTYACPECPHRLADMSGNVWEWTRSVLRPYPFDPTHDRVDLDAEPLWVMRGGSFGDTARTIRTGVRGGAGSGRQTPVHRLSGCDLHLLRRTPAPPCGPADVWGYSECSKSSNREASDDPHATALAPDYWSDAAGRVERADRTTRRF